MSDLEQLKMIAQAQYDRQQSTFTKILLEEAALRKEIVRISDLASSRSITGGAFEEMQSVGADMLWRSWLSRSKSTLNSELARVLARKAREQDKVRLSFGKLLATTTLIDQENAQIRKKAEQKILSDAIVSASYSDIHGQ